MAGAVTSGGWVITSYPQCSRPPPTGSGDLDLGRSRRSPHGSAAPTIPPRPPAGPPSSRTIFLCSATPPAGRFLFRGVPAGGCTPSSCGHRSSPAVVVPYPFPPLPRLPNEDKTVSREPELLDDALVTCQLTDHVCDE